MESQIERLRRLRDAGMLSAEEYLVAVESLVTAAESLVLADSEIIAEPASVASTADDRTADLESTLRRQHEGDAVTATGITQSSEEDLPGEGQDAVGNPLIISRDAPKSGVTVFRVGALIGLIAIAFAVGGLARSSPDREPASAQTVPDSASSRPEDRPPAPGTVPPSNDATVALTYTTDGSAPEAFPDCLGLLGFCLGESGEAITAEFGLDSERFSVNYDPSGMNLADSLSRRWVTPAGDLVVVTDPNDVIVDIQVLLSDSSPAARIAVANGLVLGDITFDDVLVAYPFTGAEYYFFEGSALVSLFVQDGPEGTIVTRFSTVLDWNVQGEQGDAYRRLREFTEAELWLGAGIDIIRELRVTSVDIGFG